MADMPDWLVFENDELNLIVVFQLLERERGRGGWSWQEATDGRSQGEILKRENTLSIPTNVQPEHNGEYFDGDSDQDEEGAEEPGGS